MSCGMFLECLELSIRGYNCFYKPIQSKINQRKLNQGLTSISMSLSYARYYTRQSRDTKMSDNQQANNAGDMSSNSDQGEEVDYSSEENISQEESVQDKNKSNVEEGENIDEEDIMQEDEQLYLIDYDNAMAKVSQEYPRIKVPNELRTTLNCISKYEYAKVIGVRAHQISKNSPLYIQIQSYQSFKQKSAIEVAELQYKQKRLPFKIIRPLPGGFYEEWALSELDDLNV